MNNQTNNPSNFIFCALGIVFSWLMKIRWLAGYQKIEILTARILYMSFRERYLTALNGSVLTLRQRQIIENRYIPAVEKMVSDHWYVEAKYNFLMLTVSIATVLVTALIALERSSGLSDHAKNAIFWVALVASFMGTVANKLLYFTGVNKQYVLEAISASRIQSEGWMFVSGAGKYDSSRMSPDEKFKLFARSYEKLISATDKGVAVSAEKSSAGLGGAAYGPSLDSIQSFPGQSPREHTFGYSEDDIVIAYPNQGSIFTGDSFSAGNSIETASTDSLYHNRDKGKEKASPTHRRKNNTGDTNSETAEPTGQTLRELFHTDAPGIVHILPFRVDSTISSEETPDEPKITQDISSDYEIIDLPDRSA